jgi:hypothetical protein
MSGLAGDLLFLFILNFMGFFLIDDGCKKVYGNWSEDSAPLKVSAWTEVPLPAECSQVAFFRKALELRVVSPDFHKRG